MIAGDPEQAAKMAPAANTQAKRRMNPTRMTITSARLTAV
jgi:hypothetical protein